MTRTIVTSSDIPPSGRPYSQGVIGGSFLFTSGFGPHDPRTGTIPAGVAAQTRQTLANIDAVIRAAGATRDDVVKVTVHLQNLRRDFAAFNEAYGEFFPQNPPVRTTVGAELFDGLVEIDAIVALPAAR